MGGTSKANQSREQYSQHSKEKEISECLVKEFEEYLRLQKLKMMNEELHSRVWRTVDTQIRTSTFSLSIFDKTHLHF